MRILIDARPLLEPRPTGVTNYARSLLDALFAIDRDNEYYLFINCFKNSVAARLPKWNHPNVHVVRSRIPNKLFHSAVVLFHAPRLDRLVERRTGVAMDVVLSLNPHFTALSPDIPFFLVVHDLSHVIDPTYFRPYDRLWHRMVDIPRLVARADHVFAVSNNTALDLQTLYHVPMDRISILYPGAPKVDVCCSNPTCPNDAPNPRILFIGTREKRKNIFGVLSAFSSIARTHPTAELYLVGAAGYRWQDAVALLNEPVLRNRVHIVGYASENDKWELLRHATVCLYPSFYEGFGLPVLEALTLGLPVVTSIGSSLPEAGADAALYCNPWRPDMIAHAVSMLLTDKNLRERLQQAGQKHIAQFSWENSARELHQALTQYAHRH